MAHTYQTDIISIPDVFKKLVQEVSANICSEINHTVNFYDGTPFKLHSQIGSEVRTRKERFPLIALVHLTEEEYGSSKVGFAETELTFWIWHLTSDENAHNDIRRKQVFKPILYPILQEFLQVIYDSNLFLFEMNVVDPVKDMRYRKTDRYNWSNDNGVTTPAGGEFVDGIELKIKLTLDVAKCSLIKNKKEELPTCD